MNNELKNEHSFISRRRRNTKLQLTLAAYIRTKFENGKPIELTQENILKSNHEISNFKWEKISQCLAKWRDEFFERFVNVSMINGQIDIAELFESTKIKFRESLGIYYLQYNANHNKYIEPTYDEMINRCIERRIIKAKSFNTVNLECKVYGAPTLGLTGMNTLQLTEANLIEKTNGTMLENEINEEINPEVPDNQNFHKNRKYSIWRNHRMMDFEDEIIEKSEEMTETPELEKVEISEETFLREKISKIEAERCDVKYLNKLEKVEISEEAFLKGESITSEVNEPIPETLNKQPHEELTKEIGKIETITEKIVEKSEKVLEKIKEEQSSVEISKEETLETSKDETPKKIIIKRIIKRKVIDEK